MARLGITVTSSGANPDTLVKTIPPAVAGAYLPPVRSSKVGIALRTNGDGDAGVGDGAGERNAVTGQVTWRDGSCDHVDLTIGRCPSAAGEVIVQESIAKDLGVDMGATLAVVELTGTSIFDADLPIVTLQVVGGYTQRPDPDYWFGATLPTSADNTATNRTLGMLSLIHI